LSSTYAGLSLLPARARPAARGRAEPTARQGRTVGAQRGCLKCTASYFIELEATEQAAAQRATGVRPVRPTSARVRTRNGVKGGPNNAVRECRPGGIQVPH
jgi:hypothetical protein